MSSGNLPKILIVEDSPSLMRCYEAYLSKESCDILLAESGGKALTLLRAERPAVVLLDMRLPDMDGLEVIKQAKAMKVACTFIAMTAHGSANLAEESMKAGALDYLEKPFTRDRLCITARNALDRARLLSQLDGVEEDSEIYHALDSGRYYGFIGASNEMQSVYRIIESASMSKATVFITGESGTGKEVCAHAIHQKSNRRNNNFVPLNCAAIPRDLMESEIFGHVKGAFTGAQSSRDGAATHADGGTLFLDEIGEMDMDLQSKLLRFIQTGTFQKVGSNRLESVDVRFVCATNRDPLEQVRLGTFREDLYYRLHVIPISLPPLRVRGSDVTDIARNFLEQFNKEEEKDFTCFTPEAEEIFLAYPWPGNIRQLQNVVRNVVVLNNGIEVAAAMLPPPLNVSLAEIREMTPDCERPPVRVGSGLPSNGQGRSARESSGYGVGGSGFSDSVSAHSGVEAGGYQRIGVQDGQYFSVTASPRKTQKSASAALSVIQQMIFDKSNPSSMETVVIKELWQVEKDAIEEAIKACGDNIPKAARCLGVSPSTIYRKRQHWQESDQL